MTSGETPRSVPSWLALGGATSGEGGPSTAEEAHGRRRRAGRRALWIAGLAWPALAVVALLDSLPALFLALVLAQVAAVVAARRRRARPRVPDDAVAVLPTTAARAWFPVVWGLMLVAIFLGTAPVRLGLCLLLACSAAAWPLARLHAERVRLVRRLPGRARAGAPTSVEYVLASDSRRPAGPFLVRDGIGVHTRPATVEAIFDVVPPGGEAVATATVVFERRGLRRMRPVEVSSRAPVGLFEARFVARAPAEVLVRPAEGRPTAALLSRLTGASRESARPAVARAGTDEFHGLRAFREGDDARRIHWRTTARRGERTYVERRDDASRRALVVLGRGADRSPAADRVFERAVSVAATVLRAAVRAGVPARLLLGGVDGATTAVRGARGLERALDALAHVRSDGGRRPLAALERVALGEGTTVVWVDAGGDGPGPRSRPGDVLLLRCNAGDLTRWVGGLP